MSQKCAHIFILNAGQKKYALTYDVLSKNMNISNQNDKTGDLQIFFLINITNSIQGIFCYTYYIEKNHDDQ